MKRLMSVLISLLLLNSLAMPLANVFAASPNLIANPSVETANGANPANWTPNNWGTNTNSLTYANTGHTGSRSLSVTTTAYTSGDAKWIPDSVAITPGQSYTYSEYFISNVATELDAEYTTASGAVSYAYLQSVPASSSWAQTQLTFTAPSTATKVSVLDILFRVGSLQTDDFSLTQYAPVVTPPNTDGNLIANPSMETANGSSPVDWQSGGWGTNSTSFSYNTNSGNTGTHSVSVQTTSYKSGDAKWYFNPVQVTAGTTYNFSDYYQSTVATDVTAVFMTSTGATSYKDLGTATASSTAWKQYTTSLIIPTGTSTMTIYHLISAIGTLKTDDYSLTIAPVGTTPSVSITTPTASANVSGTVIVSANATDGAGVKSVQFELDGNALGSPVTASPYQTTWNTTTTTYGVHSLRAIETNTAGKTTTSSTVSVTVNNVSATGNQIPNPGLETINPANTKLPLQWNTSTWGTNKTTFSYLNAGHSGQHSVKTQITSYTSGASYWYNNNIPITGGQIYDFQDYYESNTLNEIDAAVTMSDGSIDYVYVGEGYLSPNSWTHFEAQFTAPVGAVSVNFEHNIYSVGWLTTDDYSLTPFAYQGFSRPIISITNDDSYSSFYNNALPILEKYGLKSTDYIISNYIDNVSGYMTTPMVQGLYNAGQEIASHSVDHPDLTTLTAAQQDAELKNSQIFLQTLLPGTPITDYAAPYGSYNQQVMTDAAKYYQSYRSTDPGYNAKNNFNASHLVVQNLDDTTTLADVQGWIAEAQATNTWLVLVYHQVDPSSSAGLYNTYPSDFDAQMSAIKNSGITVETVSQALKEVESQIN